MRFLSGRQETAGTAGLPANFSKPKKILKRESWRVTLPSLPSPAVPAVFLVLLKSINLIKILSYLSLYLSKCI